MKQKPKKAPKKPSSARNSTSGSAALGKLLGSIRTDLATLKRKLAKRNPEGAADLYETFHGRKPEETIAVVEARRYRDQLAALGQLIAIELKTIDNVRRRVPIVEDDRHKPMLCSSPDGRQLYIEGGDQSIDLSVLGLDRDSLRKDSMVLGTILRITYRTQKDFDNFEVIDYYHMLGEETRKYPVLIYDTLNSTLQIAGGEYLVKREGIVN